MRACVLGLVRDAREVADHGEIVVPMPEDDVDRSLGTGGDHVVDGPPPVGSVGRVGEPAKRLERSFERRLP